MPGRQEYAAAMGEAAGDLGGVCGHGWVEEREIGNLGDPRRSWLRPSTVFRKAMHLREPDVVGEVGPADSTRSPGEPGTGGSGGQESPSFRDTWTARRGEGPMSTQLERIAQKARAERKLRFTALAHHLTPEFFRETWRLMNRRSASGIDGETAREFERDLDRRIPELVARLKAGKYQAPPVRRVEIPKPGSNKRRPLGIPTAEDRLLQRAVARILEAIY